MLRMRETMGWTIPILPLVVALGVSVTGCASIRAHQTAETEQVLAAAGFQVEPADTPEKLAHLQTLTPRKVVQNVRDGQRRSPDVQVLVRRRRAAVPEVPGTQPSEEDRR